MERDISLNALVKEFLEQTVSGDYRIRAAGERILEIARKGPHSEVDPASIRRDDIHKRW